MLVESMRYNILRSWNIYIISFEIVYIVNGWCINTVTLSGAI